MQKGEDPIPEEKELEVQNYFTGHLNENINSIKEDDKMTKRDEK